ncbi:MAG TPA: hypothetical protein VHN80_06765, partial [Kineosporiaceae bacterium]|nr:hypothetical protein [Kineosporiaceae bacterium]
MTDDVTGDPSGGVTGGVTGGRTAGTPGSDDDGGPDRWSEMLDTAATGGSGRHELSGRHEYELSGRHELSGGHPVGTLVRPTRSDAVLRAASPVI